MSAPEPLFILAPPRSFTSVACAMIGSHPQMCGLPETNLFAADSYEELTRLYRLRPRFQHGLLRAVAELGLGGQAESDIEAAKRWLEENSHLTSAEMFNDIRNWAAPRAVVEKSPMFVFLEGALDRIVDAYPEARFLHLTRHPRGTLESNYETRQMQEKATGKMGLGRSDEGDDNMTPEKMWLQPHLRVMETLETLPPDNYMTLRGESFMSAPDVYLPQICEWLGISTAQADVDRMMKPELSPFACMGPSNAPLGNDPNFLRSPELRPYKEKESDLDSPMSWDDSLHFDEAVQHYAMYFGY
ncbi:MAG: sulfotransferase [Pseudomonadota bacterium]